MNVGDLSFTSLLNDQNFEPVASTSGIKVSSCTTPTAQIENCNIPNETQPDSLEEEHGQTLHSYLSSINEGKALLMTYEENGLLDNSARRRLCNIIINRELQNNPDAKVTSARFYQLAYDIVKIFKKESAPVYFSPYVSISPAHKIAAKGKLLDTFRQRRREFLKSGLINTRKRKYSTGSSCNSNPPSPYSASRLEEATKTLPDPTSEAAEDTDDYLKWLKNSCDPWMTVQVYWEQTRKARFLKYAESDMKIADYFNEFRALGQSGGLHLVCIFINFFTPINYQI